jgi:tetratricopeptide (TPR) repeat protein
MLPYPFPPAPEDAQGQDTDAGGLPPAAVPLPVERPFGRYGIWDAIGLCLRLIGVQFVTAIPFAVAGIAVGLWRVPAFPYAIQALAGILAAVAVARYAFPGTVGRAVGLRGCGRAQLALAVLLAPPLVPLADSAAGLVTHALGWQPEPAPAARPPFFERLDDYYERLARLSWPWALLVGCLAPAAGEELFFRGVLGLRLVAAYGPARGVLLTSVIFGLAHIDPARAAATLLLGLAVHGAHLATRSLLAPAALHAAYNALVIGHYKLFEATWVDPTGRYDSPVAAPVLLAVSAVAVAVVGWAVWRARTRWELPDGTAWSPALGDMTLPPPGLGAVPRSAGPGAGPAGAVGVAYLALAAALTLSAGPPPDVQAAGHRERGDELYRRGDHEAAIRAYTDALEITPDDPYALGNRGVLHVLRREHARGLADLDRALAQLPADAEWLTYRAFARQCLGRSDEALDDYAGVLRLRPGDAYAHYRRGRIFLERADWSAALAELDRAWQAGDDSAEVRADRGRALFRLGRYEQAAAELEAALRRQPGHSAAVYDLVWLRAACPDDRLRDGGRAAELARGLSEAAAGQAAPLAAVAVAAAECGRFAEAVRLQEEAVRLAPAGERPFYEWLLALYRAGRPYRLAPVE